MKPPHVGKFNYFDSKQFKNPEVYIFRCVDKKDRIFEYYDGDIIALPEDNGIYAKEITNEKDWYSLLLFAPLDVRVD
jgi:hypothetical protein